MFGYPLNSKIQLHTTLALMNLIEVQSLGCINLNVAQTIAKSSLWTF